MVSDLSVLELLHVGLAVVKVLLSDVDPRIKLRVYRDNLAISVSFIYFFLTSFFLLLDSH